MREPETSSLSRRSFLQAAGATAVICSLPASARATSATAQVHTLESGWLYRRGPLSTEEARAAKDGWEAVTVPHCANAYDACDPDQPYFQGESWYKLELTTANPFPRGRTLLRFRGAGQTTRVWSGSELLGKHVGGYDEFVLDVTRTNRELHLLICCDSTPDENRSPSNLSDFCLYGGLYRNVEIIYLPAISVEQLVVQQDLQATGPATVRVSASLFASQLDPAGTACELHVELLSPGGARVGLQTVSRVAWSNLEQIAQFPIEKPERWSPATPRLYTCRISIACKNVNSTAEERFGLRHVSFPEHDVFYLNGEKLFLRGTQRHQDHAGVAGAQSDASVRQELRLIRDMGANFIRLGHYQQDRLVLDLCDELGLIVWEEVPWCRAGVGSEEWKDNTRAQMRRMIEQHRNHPSVVFWGLGNEDDWPGEHPSVNQVDIRAFMTELRDFSHRLDPTRLTSYRRCDFANDIPDVYSPSIWAGWYNGNYSAYKGSLESSIPKVKRFLHIEWGADSHAGRHSEDPYANLTGVKSGTGTEERAGDYLRSGGAVRVSRDGDWSETYACDLFDWYLKTQETIPQLAGSAQWVFKDFASPLRADSPVPRVNQKGVVARDLTPKESYAVFQSYWSAKPMVHIYGHTWPRRWGHAGEQRLVKVYSNCSHVELFLNGHSLGIRQRDSQNFPAANLRWNVTFQPGANTLRAVGRSTGRDVEDSLQLQYQTETWTAPVSLKLSEGNRVGSIVQCRAEVLDEDGVACLDARTQVRFATTGGLRMIDNLGTVGGSRVVEAANGSATIGVRKNGPGTLTVSAKGLKSGSITL